MSDYIVVVILAIIFFCGLGLMIWQEFIKPNKKYKESDLTRDISNDIYLVDFITEAKNGLENGISIRKASELNCSIRNEMYFLDPSYNKRDIEPLKEGQDVVDRLDNFVSKVQKIQKYK